MKILPALLLLAFAATAGAAAPAASGAEWGTPVGAAPAAPPAVAPAASGATTITLPRPAPSAFAAARASTQATGDYFHDFAELIVRVRSVKWIEEICDEAFPATAEANRHAYEIWRVDHGSFVDEVEGQFLIIDNYWGAASAQARKEGLTVAQLNAKVDANRAGLRQEFQMRGERSFQRRCDYYPEMLLTPQLDLEHSLGDMVRSMRLGPGSAP